MTDLTNDPRVRPHSYVVYPTDYELIPFSDKEMWALEVVDGRAWGWSVRRAFMGGGGMAMNRKGEWIWESRGSGRNKPRRWPLEEALAIALKHVDTHKINGISAAEAIARRDQIEAGFRARAAGVKA